MFHMKRFSIGCDPGKNTGVAVFDRVEKKLIEVQTVDFWRFVFDFGTRYKPENVHKLVIEVPNSKTVWHKMAKNRAAIERTGVNVGSSIREAELLVEWARLAGYEVKTCHPVGKVEAERFKKITGWEGRTNQHARDAGMLCYGV